MLGYDQDSPGNFLCTDSLIADHSPPPAPDSTRRQRPRSHLPYPVHSKGASHCSPRPRSEDWLFFSATGVVEEADGVLTGTAPEAAGPQELIVPGLTGGSYEICLEASLGGIVSSQSCCIVFVPEPCPPTVAATLNGLGEVHRNLGNYDQAERVTG